eukprot:NODE_138_length_3539_cov_5.790445.p1 GENE.NODE_138_length_3539_cov_5.790445~~NODE_138_length_3539_cov_5.790445.p1  ORF type:complete len:1031 (+),score=219.16 NODE_138_length_3539_cov_5.790445:137-3229(+)
MGENILKGVSFLHHRGVMHRSLKLDNILRVSADKFDVKIANFGRATTERRSRTMCGADDYLAPEVVRNQLYCNKVDIWNVGVIAFALLTGRRPFQEGDMYKHRMFRRILECDVDFTGAEGLTEAPRDFVLSLLALEPDQRRDALQALVHHWIKPGAAVEPPPPRRRGSPREGEFYAMNVPWREALQWAVQEVDGPQQRSTANDLDIDCEEDDIKALSAVPASYSPASTLEPPRVSDGPTVLAESDCETASPVSPHRIAAAGRSMATVYSARPRGDCNGGAFDLRSTEEVEGPQSVSSQLEFGSAYDVDGGVTIRPAGEALGLPCIPDVEGAYDIKGDVIKQSTEECTCWSNGAAAELGLAKDTSARSLWSLESTPMRDLQSTPTSLQSSPASAPLPSALAADAAAGLFASAAVAISSAGDGVDSGRQGERALSRPDGRTGVPELPDVVASSAPPVAAIPASAYATAVTVAATAEVIRVDGGGCATATSDGSATVVVAGAPPCAPDTGLCRMSVADGAAQWKPAAPVQAAVAPPEQVPPVSGQVASPQHSLGLSFRPQSPPVLTQTSSSAGLLPVSQAPLPAYANAKAGVTQSARVTVPPVAYMTPLLSLVSSRSSLQVGTQSAGVNDAGLTRLSVSGPAWPLAPLADATYRSSARTVLPARLPDVVQPRASNGQTIVYTPVSDVLPTPQQTGPALAGTEPRPMAAAQPVPGKFSFSAAIVAGAGAAPPPSVASMHMAAATRMPSPMSYSMTPLPGAGVPTGSLPQAPRSPAHQRPGVFGPAMLLQGALGTMQAQPATPGSPRPIPMLSTRSNLVVQNGIDKPVDHAFGGSYAQEPTRSVSARTSHQQMFGSGSSAPSPIPMHGSMTAPVYVTQHTQAPAGSLTMPNNGSFMRGFGRTAPSITQQGTAPMSWSGTMPATATAMTLSATLPSYIHAPSGDPVPPSTSNVVVWPGMNNLGPSNTTVAATPDRPQGAVVPHGETPLTPDKSSAGMRQVRQHDNARPGSEKDRPGSLQRRHMEGVARAAAATGKT